MVKFSEIPHAGGSPRSGPNPDTTDRELAQTPLLKKDILKVCSHPKDTLP